MTKEEVFNAVKFEGISPFKLNGEEISIADVEQTYKSKIWKSAGVIKNRREATHGGINSVVGQALQAELITKDEALNIILMNDRTKMAEIKEQLPQTEKTKDPSQEDVKQAIILVKTGGGQSVSI